MVGDATKLLLENRYLRTDGTRVFAPCADGSAPAMVLGASVRLGSPGMHGADGVTDGADGGGGVSGVGSDRNALAKGLPM